MTTENTTENTQQSNEATLRVLVQLAITATQLAVQTNDPRIEVVAKVAMEQLEAVGFRKLLESGVIQITAHAEQEMEPQASSYETPYMAMLRQLNEQQRQ